MSSEQETISRPPDGTPQPIEEERAFPGTIAHVKKDGVATILLQVRGTDRTSNLRTGEQSKIMKFTGIVILVLLLCLIISCKDKNELKPIQLDGYMDTKWGQTLSDIKGILQARGLKEINNDTFTSLFVKGKYKKNPSKLSLTVFPAIHLYGILMQ